MRHRFLLAAAKMLYRLAAAFLLLVGCHGVALADAAGGGFTVWPSGSYTWLGNENTVTCPLTFSSDITPSLASCAGSASSGVEMQAVTLAGNTKLEKPTGAPAGTVSFVTFRFVQDGNGGHTVTPAAGYSPSAWTFSSAGLRPGAVDQVTCLVDQANSYVSCGPLQNDVGGVDPTTVAGMGSLVLYGDASDPTTLYSGSGCTGGLASGGGSVGSIKDKGALHSCGVVTGTVTLTLDSNGRWYLSPNASSYITWTTGTGANPNTIAQNISYMIEIAGVEYGATSSVSQPTFFTSVNGSTAARFECGLDKVASGGLFLVGQTTDGGASSTLQIGNDANVTGVPIVQNCNWQPGNPTAPIAWLNFNNGALINSSPFGTAGNTSNTASSNGPYTGYDGTNFLSAGSRIYFVAVWTGANPGVAQQAIQSWGCTKMGIVC